MIVFQDLKGCQQFWNNHEPKLERPATNILTRMAIFAHVSLDALAKHACSNVKISGRSKEVYKHLFKTKRNIFENSPTREFNFHDGFRNCFALKCTEQPE